MLYVSTARKMIYFYSSIYHKNRLHVFFSIPSNLIAKFYQLNRSVQIGILIPQDFDYYSLDLKVFFFTCHAPSINTPEMLNGSRSSLFPRQRKLSIVRFHRVHNHDELHRSHVLQYRPVELKPHPDYQLDIIKLYTLYIRSSSLK